MGPRQNEGPCEGHCCTRRPIRNGVIEKANICLQEYRKPGSRFTVVCVERILSQIMSPTWVSVQLSYCVPCIDGYGMCGSLIYERLPLDRIFIVINLLTLPLISPSSNTPRTASRAWGLRGGLSSCFRWQKLLRWYPSAG